MKKRSVIVAIVVAVAAVLGIGVFLLAPRSTNEISGEQAVGDFRSRNKAETTTTVEERATPQPGVYTFSASGQETVKLGPLPAENRALGASITAVAEDDGAGCFNWTFNMFAEHTETTRYCADGDDALLIDVHTKNQTIGGLSSVVTMTCDPNRLSLTPGSTTDLKCQLQVSGGPFAVTAELGGTAAARSAETVTVGGEDVEATPVTIDLPVSGDVNGRWTETTWWGPTNLPVRFERTFDLQGPASFQEQIELNLQSLEPAT